LLADSQLARAKAMHAQSVGTQAELDVAEATARNAHAQVEVAKAALEQSRAGLNQAKVNLSYTNIVSPIDGVVISRAVDVGQTVAASLQAPVLFTLAEDLRKMQVDTNVSEGDVGRLDVGMPAWFTVDAFPGKRFRGTIATIRNAPQTVQNVVTYDAVIKVDNDELRLRPGMTANVTVTYAEKDHVLAVPNTALRFKPPQGSPGASLASAAASSGSAPRGGGPGSDGNRRGTARWASGERRMGQREDAHDRRSLWVMRGTSPVPVSVRIGLSDGNYTEILDGDVKESSLVAIDVEGGATVSGSPPVTPFGPQQGSRRMF
jgi:HlyD family secretion protein